MSCDGMNEGTVESNSYKPKLLTQSSRRRFLGGVAGATAALGGCLGTGNNGGNSGGGTPENSEDVSAASEINIMAVQGEGKIFERLLNNYVEEQTGVSTNVTLVPLGNLLQKVLSILENRSSDFDMFLLNDGWTPALAKHLEPVRPWLTNDYPEDQIIQQATDIGYWPPRPDGSLGNPTPPHLKEAEPKQYGVTTVGNAQMFAYNEAHYEQVGASTPPETWEDALSAGRAIDEQVDDANGYVIRGQRGGPALANCFTNFRSHSGYIYDDDFKFNWNDPEGVTAMDLHGNKFADISPEGTGSYQSDQVLTHIGNGTAAQALVWPAATSLLLDPESSPAADDISFTIAPAGPKGHAPQMGVWLSAMNKYISSSKKKAAGKVISTFITEEAQEKYVDLGGVPFRHDTFNNNMDKQPWFGALYKTLQQAASWPLIGPSQQIWDIAGTQVNKVIVDDITPKEAVETMDTKITTVFENNGFYG